MYQHSSVLIVLILLVALVLAIEIGYQAGMRFTKATDEPAKAHVGAIQGSILGVLALLLGFTFSQSLQRYDTRSEAVLAEANAIGTAMLRSDLLPVSARADSQQLIRDYLKLRIEAGSVSLDKEGERASIVHDADRVVQELWRYAVAAAEENPNPVSTGLYVQSLNEMIDAFGTRDAALNRHVPEIVLLLLFGTLVMTAALVGYSSGISRHRASFAAYILLLLIVLTSFLVIDLDRPRRGIVEVSQQSMIDLSVHHSFQR